MKKLYVAAALATLFVAPSQAQASYSIIRWTSGFCQVWDNSTPWKPFPSDYKTGKQKFRTFGRAMAFKGKLLKHRACTF